MHQFREATLVMGSAVSDASMMMYHNVDTPHGRSGIFSYDSLGMQNELQQAADGARHIAEPDNQKERVDRSAAEDRTGGEDSPEQFRLPSIESASCGVICVCDLMTGTGTKLGTVLALN